jgi:hypothetical protein
MDLERHAEEFMPWERTPASEVAGDRSDVEALRLARLEHTGAPQAAIEREIMDLFPLIDDIEHEVRSRINRDHVGCDVEAETDIDQFNADDAGAAATGMLVRNRVETARKRVGDNRDEREYEGDCGGAEQYPAGSQPPR